MMFHHMLLQTFYFIALQVNQISTLFTFAMITYCLSFSFVTAYIFKAGTAGSIYNIFRNYTFFNHLL